jgi:hypothetical protein
MVVQGNLVGDVAAQPAGMPIMLADAASGSVLDMCLLRRANEAIRELRRIALASLETARVPSSAVRRAHRHDPHALTHAGRSILRMRPWVNWSLTLGNMHLSFSSRPRGHFWRPQQQCVHRLRSKSRGLLSAGCSGT